MNDAIRIFKADDQHVLSQPTFTARLVARDSQCMAFLAEQCIAAVARTNALDTELIREVHDETTLGVEVACRVQTLDESTFFFNALQRCRTHACHELHVHDDVGTVGDLDATARVR